MSALVVSSITKSFGPYAALKHIDLSVESGSFLVLLGPSGCGKSTLLNLIAGLELRDFRRHQHRRTGREQRSRQGSRRGDGVPVLCALPEHDSAKEHYVRPRDAWPSTRGAGGRGAKGRRNAAHHALVGPKAEPVVRRTAPARGHGPRIGAGSPSSSCSTSRCRISTLSFEPKCAPRSSASISAWGRPSFT